ncbi:MAG: hypothetical protein QMD09_14505, partial [Desulfatibacillaceae bacterium]|nr:hypothetical protein [Desulfatibacillaceae bacterium]
HQRTGRFQKAAGKVVFFFSTTNEQGGSREPWFFPLNHQRTGRFQGKAGKARKRGMRECTFST